MKKDIKSLAKSIINGSDVLSTVGEYREVHGDDLTELFTTYLSMMTSSEPKAFANGLKKMASVYVVKDFKKKTGKKLSDYVQSNFNKIPKQVESVLVKFYNMKTKKTKKRSKVNESLLTSFQEIEAYIEANASVGYLEFEEIDGELRVDCESNLWTRIQEEDYNATLEAFQSYEEKGDGWVTYIGSDGSGWSYWVEPYIEDMFEGENTDMNYASATGIIETEEITTEELDKFINALESTFMETNDDETSWREIIDLREGYYNEVLFDIEDGHDFEGGDIYIKKIDHEGITFRFDSKFLPALRQHVFDEFQDRLGTDLEFKYATSTYSAQVSEYGEFLFTTDDLVDMGAIRDGESVLEDVFEEFMSRTNGWLKATNETKKPIINRKKVQEAYDKKYLEDAVNGYMEAVLFAESDDNEEPLDDNYGLEDISSESWANAENEIQKFLDKANGLYNDVEARQMGHDIYFTRQGHGTGFWDRDYEFANELSDLVDKTMSEIYVFAQDGEVILEGNTKKDMSRKDLKLNEAALIIKKNDARKNPMFEKYGDYNVVSSATYKAPKGKTGEIKLVTKMNHANEQYFQVLNCFSGKENILFQASDSPTAVKRYNEVKAKYKVDEALSEGKIMPSIEEFIKSVDLTQLKSMEKQLSREIKNGLLKDREDHSYTAELDLIKSRIKKLSEKSDKKVSEASDTENWSAALKVYTKVGMSGIADKSAIEKAAEGTGVDAKVIMDIFKGAKSQLSKSKKDSLKSFLDRDAGTDTEKLMKAMIKDMVKESRNVAEMKMSERDFQDAYENFIKYLEESEIFIDDHHDSMVIRTSWSISGTEEQLEAYNKAASKMKFKGDYIKLTSVDEIYPEDADEDGEIPHPHYYIDLIKDVEDEFESEDDFDNLASEIVELDGDMISLAEKKGLEVLTMGDV